MRRERRDRGSISDFIVIDNRATASAGSKYYRKITKRGERNEETRKQRGGGGEKFAYG
jgi:hypothetical protein